MILCPGACPRSPGNCIRKGINSLQQRIGGIFEKQRLLDSLAWRAHTRLPKKEDVPGYVRGVYDVPGHFEAMALYWEIWPFYRGSDNKPFDCLEAEVVNAPIYRGDQGGATRYHSYYPREGCRHLYRRRDVI